MIDPGLGALLEEGLASLGAVKIRRMFGGAGVFLDATMFALVIDDELYFKTDDVNRPAYEAEGLTPFSYARKDGRTTVMSYWRAPERLLDDPEELLAWATEALAAARRRAKPAKNARAPRRRA